MVEFESTEERDYYITGDPEHMAFGQFVRDTLEDITVFDFTPGEFK